MHVDVEYGGGHKPKLDQSPVASQIAQVVRDGLQMSEEQLFAHMIFTEQSRRDGFRTYQQLKSRLPRRQGYFEDYVKTSGDHAWVVGGGTKDIVERIGVAVALVILNQVYGLHEADWERIKETSNKKTLDFRCASTGAEFVHVEARGHRPGLSWTKMEKEIREKKDDLDKQTSACQAYGIVAVVPQRSGKHIEARVFDPESQTPDREPREYRLLARYAFYARMLALISTNHLALAAQDRLRVLTQARNPFEFDGVPLVNVVGEPIPTPPKDWGFATDKTLYSYDGGWSIGRVFPVPPDQFLFFGMDAAVFGIMGRQDLRALLDIGANHTALFRPDSLIENALVSVEAMQAADMSYNEYPRSEKTGSLHLRLRGPVVHMPSGIAYGRLRRLG